MKTRVGHKRVDQDDPQRQELHNSRSAGEGTALIAAARAFIAAYDVSDTRAADHIEAIREALAAAPAPAPIAQPQPEPDTVPVPTITAWSGGAAPYRFIRVRLDDTPTEYEYVPAAPEQAEPVAWMVTHIDGEDAYVTANPRLANSAQRALPLYTAPVMDTCSDVHSSGPTSGGGFKIAAPQAPAPIAQPLTDEQLQQIIWRHTNVDAPYIRAIARAVERAHGIGAQPLTVASWTCAKCGTDRLKAPCPLGYAAQLDGRCPCVGVAAAGIGAQKQEAPDDNPTPIQVARRVTRRTKN